jgi:hypothetical protein
VFPSVFIDARARLHNEHLEKVTFDVEWLANESLPCTGEHSRCEENTPNKLAKTKKLLMIFWKFKFYDSVFTFAAVQ